jgi:hypothetical protein
VKYGRARNTVQTVRDSSFRSNHEASRFREKLARAGRRYARGRQFGHDAVIGFAADEDQGAIRVILSDDGAHSWLPRN